MHLVCVPRGLAGGWLGVAWGLPGGSEGPGPRNPLETPSKASRNPEQVKTKFRPNSMDFLLSKLCKIKLFSTIVENSGKISTCWTYWEECDTIGENKETENVRLERGLTLIWLIKTDSFYL